MMRGLSPTRIWTSLKVCLVKLPVTVGQDVLVFWMVDRRLVLFFFCLVSEQEFAIHCGVVASGPQRQRMHLQCSLEVR